MQFADAVFYDETVNIELIEYIRRDAEKFPQTISSEILLNYQHAIELAKQGQRVLYLLAGHEILPKNEALTTSDITTQELISGS
jgi:uroporphyrin-III C-methyltransferase/precorrin-2 dehydrogenase/sirohydrochlorin ferrochelatase